ncbi:MAG: hypothetical protein LBU65_05125 [Planctomycetaceae bacterium]|nr:hypothetical protein [Planctomycetaceae bacterium]
MLDLTDDPNPVQRNKNSNQPDKQNQSKKFIGIRFNCCGVYSRIYVNKEGTAYEGRCPKCMQTVCLKIGGGGTDTRFFETY